MPATASQKLPAPRPSSNRPPLMTSSDAAALAIIVGGAHRQAGDIREEPEPLRPRQQVGDQRERVEVPALVRVVLDPDEVEAASLGGQHLGDDRVVLVRDRRDGDPELKLGWHGHGRSAARRHLDGQTGRRDVDRAGEGTPCHGHGRIGVRAR